ncbi:MAG TPA: TIGR02757 family protein [Thermoanaerobaculia bacterium]|nr:TIGR02757 family protein [Thermoanaerobaculia bacterium]
MTLSPRDRLLAERLENLYRTYGPETAGSDPIGLVSRYTAPEDREVAGWIASAFAYGRVETIRGNVGRVLEALGPRPARALESVGDVSAFVRERLPGFRHRFHGARDAAGLLHAIAKAREDAGSVRAFFEAEFRPEEPDIAGLLSRAVGKLLRLDYRPALGARNLPEDSPVRFFFPDPASGSACKRWNLYLRWMVRRDRLDFGLWSGIPTDRLIVPTDTHIHLIARRLRLTRRRTANWTTAREITRRLARFDPRDPVRFDYALCRIGIFGICQAAEARSRCGECLAEEACPVGRKKRNLSRDGKPREARDRLAS